MGSYLNNFYLKNTNNFKLGFELALIDIKLKYRSTILGNWWIILTYLITILILSSLWSVVTDRTFKIVFPNLFIGITTFFFVNGFISSSSKILYENYKGVIKGLAQKQEKINARHFLTLVIEYLHIIPVYIVVLLLFDYKLTSTSLLSFLGLVLVILNCYWILFLISSICARYRDLSLLISSFMSPMMLMTPILWDKEKLGIYSNYVYINPLTSFVEAIRDPLIKNEVNFNVYIYLLVFLIFGNLLSGFFYKFKRKHINFWL